MNLTQSDWLLMKSILQEKLMTSNSESVDAQIAIMLTAIERKTIYPTTSDSSDLPEPQRWIPVTDRMPEGTCEVVICINEMNVGTARYEYFDNCGWLFTNDSYEIFHSDEVTHWMPLPVLPE